MRLHGDEHQETLREASNCAISLIGLNRIKEAKAMLCKTMPVARRVLGDSHDLTLKMRLNYAATLCNADGATLDDVREAVTMLEETARTARRVFGIGGHPSVVGIEDTLRQSREVLRAHETPQAWGPVGA
jgi:hypothetical protein